MNPVALPGRLVGGVLARLSDSPLAVSGAVMAVAAVLVLTMRVQSVSDPGTTLQTVSPLLVVSVLVAHPAYAVAVVVGLWAAFFWR